MNYLVVLLSVATLISCSGNHRQVSSAEEWSELDSNCETLQASYVMNDEAIDTLNAAMAMDSQEEMEIHIQVTALGMSMGAEEITSPESMLALLNDVKLEYEQALESCDDSSSRAPALKSRGESIAVKKAQNLQHLGSSKN